MGPRASWASQSWSARRTCSARSTVTRTWVLPLVSVLSSLLNYLLSLPMMFLLIALVQLATLGRLNFRWTVAYLPVLLIIQTMLLSGLALLMSALAVRFRDFVHLIGILMQFWFFLTPVVYSLDALNATVAGVPLAAAVRWLNPMASLIEFYREILYGQAVPAPNVPRATPCFSRGCHAAFHAIPTENVLPAMPNASAQNMTSQYEPARLSR